MSELPKIVQARLRANPRATGDPRGPADSSISAHPDANLLTAFAEKTLTGRERTAVLSHLNQCAECREVAAFVLPTEGTPTELPRAVPARHWSPWLFLRWGAMAAALGVLTIVVTVHPGLWKGKQEITKVTPPAPTPGGSGSVSTGSGSLAPAPSAALSAPTMAKPEPRSVANDVAAEKGLQVRREMQFTAQAASPKAKEQVNVMAATSPPATLRAANIPAAPAEQKTVNEESGITVTSLPAPPPSPAPSPAAVTADSVTSAPGPQAAPTAVRGRNQTVMVTAAAAPVGMQESPAEKVASPRPAAGSGHMLARSSLGGLMAARQDVANPAGASGTQWSVSPDGKVLRSTDGGKTVETVHVARGVKFRAVSALGNEVWAGGTGGGLLHSSDGGATWKQVTIPFEGTHETIVGIQLPDLEHITIATSSGSRWKSDDGGQTWRNQP